MERDVTDDHPMEAVCGICQQTWGDHYEYDCPNGATRFVLSTFTATLDREPEKVEPKFGPFPFYDRMSDALGLPRMTTAGGWELFGRALTPRSVPRCMRNGEFMWGIEATYVGAAPSKTPTLDKLENTSEPKRPPLNWDAKTKFDKFDGFVVTSNTSPDAPSKNTGFPAWRADTAATHRLGAGVKS